MLEIYRIIREKFQHLSPEELQELLDYFEILSKEVDMERRKQKLNELRAKYNIKSHE